MKSLTWQMSTNSFGGQQGENRFAPCCMGKYNPGFYFPNPWHLVALTVLPGFEH
ncbi:hypothetical protein [Mangrovibacter phragmitis]|jgi:hypothetical protein|uniref:hypothetical protein n=1 Tax=Mangrovibacter phragmitis TaxID=1691903 RepID=UPI003369CE94